MPDRTSGALRSSLGRFVAAADTPDLDGETGRELVDAAYRRHQMMILRLDAPPPWLPAIVVDALRHYARQHYGRSAR